MTNLNIGLKTLALGSALFLGHVLATKTPKASNAVMDDLFKGLSTDRRQPCQKFLASVIYNSYDKTLIARALKNCKQYTLGTIPGYNFTLMHLAAIGGNAVAIPFLKKAGIDPNKGDRLDYTSLIHAAMLGDTHLVQALLDNGADPNKRTYYGATYMDFLRWNKPFRESQIPLNHAQFSAHTEEDPYTIDKTCFDRGVSYVEEVVASPEVLTHIWNHDRLSVREPLTNFQKDLIEKYAFFKKQPPKLAVQHIKKDDLGQRLRVKGQLCGLVALQLIPRGHIIAEYVGEIYNKEKPSKSSYSFSGEYFNLDGKQYRSAAAMANDGFPNASFRELTFDYRMNSTGQPQVIAGVDGLPGRTFIFADDDIEEGEQIVLDYGLNHSIKKVASIEMAPGARNKFFGKHTWSDLLKSNEKNSVNSDRLDPEELNYHLGIVKKFIYLLATPRAIQETIYLGYFTEKDLVIATDFVMNTPSLQKAQQSLLKNILLAEKALKTKKPNKIEL